MTARVMLMCGLTGAGKTTYALELEREGFARLSVDEYIWQHYGVFGVDFDEPQWIGYQEEAEASIRERLVALIAQGADVVVDLSFWSRAMRDDYKALVEEAGGAWELVYIKVDPAVLPARVEQRRLQGGANAFPIPPEMLARFIAGFEEPVGEGEQVIVSS